MTDANPTDPLLVVDIGNTSISLAVSDEDGLHHAVHVPSAEPATWDDALRGTFASIADTDHRQVVIASVNPPVHAAFVERVEAICGAAPLNVRSELPLPMPLEIDHPDEVGVDRVCSAAAAYERVRGVCAVASFGTAMTVDSVSSDGRFLGGTIAPGLDLALDALHRKTAQLPAVTLETPASPFGKNTRDAMLAGVTFGAVGALREIVERFATELGEWPHLLLTGGRAGQLQALVEFADGVAPHLCLMGVALAYRRGRSHR